MCQGSGGSADLALHRPLSTPLHRHSSRTAWGGWQGHLAVLNHLSVRCGPRPRPHGTQGVNDASTFTQGEPASRAHRTQDRMHAPCALDAPGILDVDPPEAFCGGPITPPAPFSPPPRIFPSTARAAVVCNGPSSAPDQTCSQLHMCILNSYRGNDQFPPLSALHKPVASFRSQSMTPSSTVSASFAILHSISRVRTELIVLDDG